MVEEKRLEKYISRALISDAVDFIEEADFRAVSTLNGARDSLKEGVVIFNEFLEKDFEKIRSEIKRVCADINKIISSNKPLFEEYVELRKNLGRKVPSEILKRGMANEEKVEKLMSSIELGSLDVAITNRQLALLLSKLLK